ncbi:MAG: hypothetical protein ACF788_00855 [Novipirellula sp. JB048]
MIAILVALAFKHIVWAYLSIKGTPLYIVNFAICQAFEENGIQFSLPLRHSYWKTDDTQGPLEVSWNEPSSTQRPTTASD